MTASDRINRECACMGHTCLKSTGALCNIMIDLDFRGVPVKMVNVVVDFFCALLIFVLFFLVLDFFHGLTPEKNTLARFLS